MLTLASFGESIRASCATSSDKRHLFALLSATRSWGPIPRRTCGKTSSDCGYSADREQTDCHLWQTAHISSCLFFAGFSIQMLLLNGRLTVLCVSNCQACACSGGTYAKALDFDEWRMQDSHSDLFWRRSATLIFLFSKAYKDIFRRFLGSSPDLLDAPYVWEP